MKLNYLLLDVFTRERLKGNQLAVVCKADGLLAQNRDFHKLLTKIGYRHAYEELPAAPSHQDRGPLSPWTGGHDWNYWDLAVQHALIFHCRQLGIPLRASPAGWNRRPSSGRSKTRRRSVRRSTGR